MIILAQLIIKLTFTQTYEHQTNAFIITIDSGMLIFLVRLQL